MSGPDLLSSRANDREKIEKWSRNYVAFRANSRLGYWTPQPHIADSRNKWESQNTNLLAESAFGQGSLSANSYFEGEIFNGGATNVA